MSWTVFAGVLSGIALGLVTNELSDVSPWLARKVLRRASRWEAVDNTEAELVFEEQREVLESVPGRLFKLMWAVGRLRFGLVRKLRRAANLPKPGIFTADTLVVYGMLFMLTGEYFNTQAINGWLRIAWPALLGVSWLVTLVTDARRYRAWRRRRRAERSE